MTEVGTVLFIAGSSGEGYRVAYLQLTPRTQHVPVSLTHSVRQTAIVLVWLVRTVREVTDTMRVGARVRRQFPFASNSWTFYKFE